MNNQVVVLFCIIGSGAIVFLGWAISHRFNQDTPKEATEGASSDFSQAQYMREVRAHNYNQLIGMHGGRHA